MRNFYAVDAQEMVAIPPGTRDSDNSSDQCNPLTYIVDNGGPPTFHPRRPIARTGGSSIHFLKAVMNVGDGLLHSL
ncbi:hypothetical protein K474DRAFT_1667799 [Panus rudis PR-1116 ss-1]|nr:hypothetical protein K474DRAFT_1667799 [Panus rudis PR-1116 ss-1]